MLAFMVTIGEKLQTELPPRVIYSIIRQDMLDKPNDCIAFV